MAKTYQLASTPGATDYPFVNLTGADIPANTAVILDTSKVLGDDTDGIPIALPGADGVPVIGVTQEIIRNGQTGIVRCLGPMFLMKCDGAVAPGALVMASAGVGKVGFAKTLGAAKAQVGMSLDGGADTEETLILYVPAKNA